MHPLLSKGCAGFSKKLTLSEVINLLRVHGISSYAKGVNTCPVDSNFLQNQALRAVVYHRNALSVDVLPVLQMLTELDGAFDPGRLIFN